MIPNPIETRYKGYRFRSRLEARWAVFFDSLGIAWEYEKEGFNLDAGRYLPDFYLTKSRLWVEVKGEWPNEDALKKAIDFRESQGMAIAVFGGLPTESAGKLFCWDLTHASGGTSEWDVSFLNLNEKAYLWVIDRRADRQLFADEYWHYELPVARVKPDCRVPCELIEFAANRAKAARFEHGETPS